MKPRLRAELEGEIAVPWKLTEEDLILERCCGVPIKRNSVFEGFTVKRFDVSH